LCLDPSELLKLASILGINRHLLRLAGLKARSSAQGEYEETIEDLSDDPLPPEGQPDWVGRAIAFKGVFLEGVEIVLIVGVAGALVPGPRARSASPARPEKTETETSCTGNGKCR